MSPAIGLPPLRLHATGFASIAGTSFAEGSTAALRLSSMYATTPRDSSDQGYYANMK